MAASQIAESVHDESTPLLVGKPPKKPFYRARPLWLVPFAIIASLVRGMTLAPRLEVFTQLSCNNLYGHHDTKLESTSSNLSSSSIIPDVPFYPSLDPLGPHFIPYTLFHEGEVIFIPNPDRQSQANPGTGSKGDDSDSDDTEDPRNIPSARCLSDPAVQAGAARLQTIMTTTMGLLSALTTGWWGHYSERHGRTRVLAFSTLGLFLTGSRAHIFSRFTGAVAVGFSVGPAIGGWLIRNPISWLVGSPTPGRQSITSVFWAAIFCSLINFLFMVFVFPESLDKEKRERAMIAYQKMGTISGRKGKARERALTLSAGDLGGSGPDEDSNQEEDRLRQEESESGVRSGGAGIIGRFLSPLAVFLPVMVLDPSSIGRKRRDWSLTLLAAALFGYMLSTGVYQIKYRYAEHVYGWGAEQLSYYISFMGGARAVFLLFLLPTLISLLKPKPLPHSEKGKGKPPVLSNSSNTNTSTSVIVHQPPQPVQKGKKPKPTRAQLGQEIGFDLLLTRCSLMIDILSQSLVVVLPSPALKAHNLENPMSLMKTTKNQMNLARSEAMFVVASSLSSMGSGVVPAVHSLALCMLQVRALDDAAASVDGVETKEEGTGTLFGAFAVLQAVGQMILGPMIFGLVYSGTVANFPKAVFTVAAGFLVFALLMVLCVRNPVQPIYPGRSKRRKNREGRDVERGRSRVSKDLTGGAHH